MIGASASSRILLLTGILAVSLVSLSYGQAPAKRAKVKMELPDSLVKQAKVAEGAARKTALASVPNGTVRSVELEKEKGKLIYSYDIKVAGKKGITEVGVDAMTGAVVSTEHEDDAKEAKEAKGKDSENDKPKAARPRN